MSVTFIQEAYETIKKCVAVLIHFRDDNDIDCIRAYLNLLYCIRSCEFKYDIQRLYIELYNIKDRYHTRMNTLRIADGRFLNKYFDDFVAPMQSLRIIVMGLYMSEMTKLKCE